MFVTAELSSLWLPFDGGILIILTTRRFNGNYRKVKSKREELTRKTISFNDFVMQKEEPRIEI